MSLESSIHESSPRLQAEASRDRARIWIRSTVRLAFAFSYAYAAVALSVLASPVIAADDPSVEYNRDIRPILSENCFACHGPDSASRKADLRLDQREAAITAGALAPGDTEGSELLHRIASSDPDEVMPPPRTTKKLTSVQKETLARWIKQGAKYQPHWSLIPPKRPTLPSVKDSSWVRNPIDQWILARLESIGLKPAAEADRRTLARRLSLDLTGLPPEPALVDRFVNDTAPDAYELYVDQLLRSPRWGEHRARYWLDLARYADTNGYHFDNYRENWAYRDWVIDAFNRNLPFDQFTLEQLAGDLLPNPTLAQKVASGFNRCNMTTNEGGVIPDEYQVLYTRDRTETTSQVWMGLTVGCAVCHDHKFDPISQKEFYALSAFFNNTTQPVMDGNIKDTPPIMVVPQSQDQENWQRVLADLTKHRGELDARRPIARGEFDKWLSKVKPEEVLALASSEGLKLAARLSSRVAANPAPGASDAGAVLELADTGDFERDQAFTASAWVRIEKQDVDGAIVARMDDQKGNRGWDLLLQNGRLVSHLINKWPDNGFRVQAVDPIPSGQWVHVAMTYDGSSKSEGVKLHVNGQAVTTRPEPRKLTETIKTTVPFKVGQRHTTLKLKDAQLSDVRVHARPLSTAELVNATGVGRALDLVMTPADKRDKTATENAFTWWLASFDKPSQEINTRITKLETERAAIQSRGTIAHVMQERGDPAKAHILFRGDYDKRKDEVTAATPNALPPMPSNAPLNRLGLARWLLAAEHPLTARVTVNRFWQEIFGTGIVRTTGDFGVSGELPVNQELLDWLAVDYRESGWDVKRFFKQVVMSATYRQSAATTPEKLEKDPQNRLLSRGPRFRMDAEMVRDYALAASGLLTAKIGGPSVKPYQPEGVWEAVAMPGSNTRDYKTDAGEALYRRGIYTFWKRSAPPASLEILNAPSREVCAVRRERTNTPLQALVTLNDPQFVESARHLAELVLREGGSTNEARLDLLARRLLARPFRPEEQSIVLTSLEGLMGYYQQNVEDAKKLITVGDSKPDPTVEPRALAAWTMLANELMNLDEALNK